VLAPLLRPQRVRFLTSAQDLGQPGSSRPPRADLLAYAGALRQMAARSSAAGADPVFLVLPAPLDFDRVPVPEVVAEYRQAMCQVAAEVEAPCLDGPTLFREAGAGPAWFLDQVHPAAVGHELLGEALAEVLGAEG
jgi:lysophospholipase L1-like esterase